MIAGLEAWLADAPWMTVLTFFIDLAIKSALICAVAAIATLLLRRSSAHVRDTVWIFAVVGLLLLPTLAVLSPVWNVPIIPDLASLSSGSYLPDSEKPEQSAPGASPATRADTPEVAGTSSGSAASGVPWYAWGILAWIAGGVLCLCWNLILHAGVRSVVRRAVPADRRWTVLLDGVARELDLRRKVRLLESGGLKAAVTVGIVEPVIVLPSDCDEWPASRRRLVLSHEVAHVKRWDTLIEMFALLATIVYWFNPLVWYAVNRLRIERETDCDNAVLRTGAKPSEYAELLMTIAADLSASTTPAWQLSTISQSSNVKDRLMDILNQRVDRATGSRRSAIVTGVIALSLVLPISTSSLWSDATSQTDEKAKKEKKVSDHEKKAKYEEMSDEEKAKYKAEKKAKWDAMSDEEKAKYKAQQKAEWDALSAEEKSASMWKKVCQAENSAACIVGKKMKKHGVEAGLEAFDKMKHAEEGKYIFKEKEFNSLGYAFFYVERTDEAIAVLELNVKEYPDSWNCYDSLGEAYMVAKKYDKAVKYYELAVNMNPESEHSRDQLAKLRTLLAGKK
jgi:beta-lactamase regulating signal transducer with metallopeptidase domain